MKVFLLIWLAVCVVFADAFFPYTAWALGAWVVVALATIPRVAR